MNGHSVNAGGHGFGWDDAELFAIGVIFVETVDHFTGYGTWSDAGQLGDLLHFRIVCVYRAELTS